MPQPSLTIFPSAAGAVGSAGLLFVGAAGAAAEIRLILQVQMSAPNNEEFFSCFPLHLLEKRFSLHFI